MGASGESIRRLTDFGNAPSWSPDGRSLVVSSGSKPGSWNPTAQTALWIVDVASGVPHKIFERAAVFVRPGCWSPSGSRIAFSASRGRHIGQPTLWTIPSAGGTPVEVKAAGKDCRPKAWTHEGLWYSAPSNGPLGIWRIRVDELTGASTSDPELILQPTGQARNPSPTADGRRVIFQVGTFATNILRWDVNLSTRSVSSSPKPIASQNREMSLWGAPSPDGQWLVTYSEENENPAGGDIVLVRVDSGETRRLTSDRLAPDSFSWAPDGSKLYFCIAPTGPRELWSIRTDGSGREKVLGGAPEGEIRGATASPDGRTIYVAAGTKNAPYLLDTSVEQSNRRLIPLPPLAEELSFAGRAWSPDGSELLGYARTKSGTLDTTLWVFNLERKTYSKLTKLPATWSCFWLPGSLGIVVTDGRELKIVDRDTGAITPVGSVGDDIVNLQLSSDGRSLYGDRYIAESDIWMLDYTAAK